MHTENRAELRQQQIFAEETGEWKCGWPAMGGKYERKARKKCWNPKWALKMHVKAAVHFRSIALCLRLLWLFRRLKQKRKIVWKVLKVNLFSLFLPTDINQAHKNRRTCSLIGVEGGHSLGGSLGVLRTFYSLGVRYMTLTSTCHTPWADSSNADAPKYDVKHGGLTAYGKVSWK